MPQQNTASDWLSARECAEYLRLSLRALYARCAMRSLPFYRLGGSLRFKRSELDKFIERQRVVPIH